MMKRATVTAMAVAAMVLTAAPAIADAPATYEITRVAEGETDPCNGETMTVNFTWQVSEHNHDGRSVIRFDGIAVSSNGSVGYGTETQVVNDNWITTTFNWISVNDETRERFTVKGRVKIDLDTGEFVKFDVDNFRCLGTG